MRSYLLNSRAVLNCGMDIAYSMFLSRTVAAEVCMEAKSNEPAYSALKKLDQSGDLLFELSCVFYLFFCAQSSEL